MEKENVIFEEWQTEDVEVDVEEEAEEEEEGEGMNIGAAIGFGFSIAVYIFKIYSTFTSEYLHWSFGYAIGKGTSLIIVAINTWGSFEILPERRVRFIEQIDFWAVNVDQIRPLIITS